MRTPRPRPPVRSRGSAVLGLTIVVIVIVSMVVSSVVSLSGIR
jgi:hypothetical protein